MLKKKIHENNDKIITIKKNKSTKNKIVDKEEFDNLIEDTNNIDLNKKVINDNKNINDNDKIKKINKVKSETAKNGYKEEDNVCNDLNNNVEIKQLFENFIKKKYDGNKCKIDISNDEYIFIQVKKYKKNQFGQLDRHWISDIIKQIPDLHP